MDFRLEDHFCDPCLSGHRKRCAGGQRWCECFCIADHDDVVRARQAFRLHGMRLSMPPETNEEITE